MHKTNLLLILLIFLLTFCSRHNSENKISRQPAPISDTLSLAFYNVENLFDFENDGTEYPEYMPGAANWTHEMQKRKVENIASVIAAMHATVAGLCEVEDRDALDDLVKALKQRMVDYPYVCIAESPRKKSTYPALISKIAIRRFQSIATGADPSFRPILEVHIANGDRDFVVFVNHWPSKQHPESYRVAAARVLATRLKELPSGSDYVVIGDLNCDYDECVRNRFGKLDDTQRTTGLNHILGTAISEPSAPVRYVVEKDMTGSGGVLHYDLWFEMPSGSRYSRMNKGLRETPDHILCPVSMFDSTGISYCDNSFSNFTMEGKLLKNGVPVRWQMRYSNRRRIHAGEGYSDHLPVIAKFVNKSFSFKPADSTRTGSIASKDIISMADEWTCCNLNFSSVPDIVSGKHYTKVSGDPGEKNGCAVKTIIQIPRSASAIHLQLRGEGKLSLRIRLPRQDWIYYNGEEFKQSKSARYMDCSFPRWKEAVLSLPERNGENLAEMEIRAGKEKQFRFWLGKIEFK